MWGLRLEPGGWEDKRPELEGGGGGEGGMSGGEGRGRASPPALTGLVVLSIHTSSPGASGGASYFGGGSSHLSECDASQKPAPQKRAHTRAHTHTHTQWQGPVDAWLGSPPLAWGAQPPPAPEAAAPPSSPLSPPHPTPPPASGRGLALSSPCPAPRARSGTGSLTWKEWKRYQKAQALMIL